MFEPCLKVKNKMDKFGFPWFVAGGWAIDLFLGRETRAQADVEIGIYRKNQMQLCRFFSKSKKQFVDNRNYTGKRERHEWTKEYLRLPIHELYIDLGGLELKVLLNERDDHNWVYRRDPRIQLEEDRVILLNGLDIPYLCPQIVCLCKTKDMGDKDRADIALALHGMDEAQRKWLFDSLKDRETRDIVRALMTGTAP